MLITPEDAVHAYKSELEQKEEALFTMLTMDCPEAYNQDRIQQTIARIKRITEKVCEAERKMKRQ